MNAWARSGYDEKKDAPLGKPDKPIIAPRPKPDPEMDENNMIERAGCKFFLTYFVKLGLPKQEFRSVHDLHNQQDSIQTAQNLQPHPD